MASQLEEQQEKLRRVVEEWRSRIHDLLKDLHGDPFGYCPSAAGSSSSDPVRIHVEPVEHSGLSALLESDNAAVSKFITVLSYDCIEISRLQQHASRNLYRQLLVFGHSVSTHELLVEGEPQKAFGRSLSLFMELHETTSRMTDVLGNLMLQLSSICSPHDKNARPLNSFKNFTLPSVFASLGDGMSVFLVLDEILKQNSRVKGYLSHFARMLKKVKFEVDAFCISVEDLDFLDQVVSRLEKLLDFGLFQQLLQGESSLHATLQHVRCNRKFIDACSSCIHDGLVEILPRLDTWKESPFDRRKILHYVALLLLFSYASAEAPEKKIWKLILEMLQVVPVIYVEGGKRIVLLDVLKSQFPKSLSSWSPMREVSRDCDIMKRNYLIRLSGMHLREWKAVKDALSSWIPSFQSTVYPVSEMLSEACLRFHMKQIMQGILLASKMRTIVLSMLDLHVLLEVPIRKEILKSLCHMVVSLKVLENMFRIKGLEIIQSLPHIINTIQADIEQFILPVRDKLHSEVIKGSLASKLGFLSSLTHGGRDTDTRLADSLSLVLISLQMLQGGGSDKRQLILYITTDVLQSIGHAGIDFSRIRKVISKLVIVADFQSIVEEVTDCSFLYWRKEMISNWFSMVYTDVSKFVWLQYLLDAFSDGLRLLQLGRVGKLTLQSYEKEIEGALENEIIAPLSRDVETDLRLHVHSTHLKGSVSVNPTKTGVRSLSWYLQMKPLRLPFKLIDVKSLVESYLNSSFYNHTAISSSDWKIYSEMRQLAELKYGLALDDIHLVEHSMDHDFDICEIIQNLYAFTENYSYDIFNQVFIEKVPNGQGKKTLRVIGLENVASTIATHGLRTLSCASDSIFNFLTLMFTTLSESLKDKYVSSHLLKEINLWKGGKGTIKTCSFVQEGDFNIAIGKLPLGDHGLNPVGKLPLGDHGLNPVGKLPLGDHGLNPVEHLQSVITKIGNALGLMKILLAGDSRHSCNISRFINKSRYNMSFMESCQKVAFLDEIVTAGRVMDISIENNCRSEDHTKSYSFYITMFSKELQSHKYHHLANFFVLIPSLIVSMVDSRVHYKDKQLKRDQSSGSSVNTYDGFIMGAAYVLKVMGQEKSFDELNWFSSAKKNLEEEISSLKDSGKGPEPRKDSTSLSALKLWGQAPSISAEAQKRIDKCRRHQKEIELVECALNVARTVMS